MRQDARAIGMAAALLPGCLGACQPSEGMRVPVVYANNTGQDLLLRVTDDGGPGPGTTNSYRLAAGSRAILPDQRWFEAVIFTLDCRSLGSVESTALLDPLPAYLRVVVGPDLRAAISPVRTGDPRGEAVADSLRPGRECGL